MHLKLEENIEIIKSTETWKAILKYEQKHNR